MKKKWSAKLVLIIFIALVALAVNWVKPLKMGLDLQGGTHLVLDTDMSQIAEVDRSDALN